ncbi:hypothetical protein TNCV_4759901 [Trichonephila clavipes]|nr:hypothetical protein TNCV_4759901 [Trichonephila clavipes]
MKQTDEDEDNNNESSKGTSNADAFSAVCFPILLGSYLVFGYTNNHVSERCSVPINSDKRCSTHAGSSWFEYGFIILPREKNRKRLPTGLVFTKAFILRHLWQDCLEESSRTSEIRCSVTVNFPDDFCDEAHFWLNGYVNKQNCRIWSEANAQVYVETPLHPEKLTVWCALWAGGILLQKR